MSIQLDREITQDFDRAAGLEWLETNGLGGWAGTTVAGAHSRRYHGLLVAATQPPAGRTVLLSRLDETLHVRQRAGRVHKRFQEVFWNEKAGYLYDVVNGEERDAALRPNQIFALSLPFPLLPKPKAARMLAAVEEKLYTPVGLRTLAPGHPDCEPNDHQGMVWSWLLGPYATALVRVHGAAGRKKTLAAFEELRPRLAEAGVGSLPEVFDAEAPHSPRGCIARAWSVAEVLRAYVEDLQGGGKGRKTARPSVA